MWLSVEEAVKKQGSKASWHRWIAAGTVPTKVEAGKRLVWVTASPVELLERELEHHREERLRWAQVIVDQAEDNEKLVAELQRVKEKLVELESQRESLSVRPLKTKSLSVRPPKNSNPSYFRSSGRILPARHASILRQIEAEGFSLREVEAGAEIAKRFLTKAKLGQRSGPRSVASWAKIRAFLESQQRKTA